MKRGPPRFTYFLMRFELCLTHVMGTKPGDILCRHFEHSFHPHSAHCFRHCASYFSHLQAMDQFSAALVAFSTAISAFPYSHGCLTGLLYPCRDLGLMCFPGLLSQLRTTLCTSFLMAHSNSALWVGIWFSLAISVAKRVGMNGSSPPALSEN